jgi:poly-gamma-glutamate synthase PgsB/CapB
MIHLICSNEERPISEIVVTGIVFFASVIYLSVEKFRSRLQLRSIPLRICVTGTRGKSSVTRLIAAVLREAGYRTLAKTTGSRPVLIHADGSEKEIRRHGRPTILEGKKVLKIARDESAEAVVLELMGIAPETIFTESVRMIEPHILVITNVRLDHTAQIGSSKEEIASCFASAIPEDGNVFVLEDEMFPVFRSVAEQRKCCINTVQSEIPRALVEDRGVGIGPFEFSGDIQLALAVAGHLGIGTQKALEAMTKTIPDVGSLKIWKVEKDSSEPGWFFVNAFAANDPESTREIFSVDKVRAILEGRRAIGLLNLREDRGDRTLQWLGALERNEFPELDRVVFLGRHAFAARRKLKGIPKDRIKAWPKLSPAEIVQRLFQQEQHGAVLIGMGNMKGAGKAFVDLWEKTGDRYDG